MQLRKFITSSLGFFLLFIFYLALDPKSDVLKENSGFFGCKSLLNGALLYTVYTYLTLCLQP